MSDLDHPYSPSMTVGDLVFVSGCLPVDEEETIVTGRREALDAALTQVGRRLKGTGATVNDLIRLTYFVTDITLRNEANEQFEASWPEPRPARSMIGVASLPRGATVEIEVIARIPNTTAKEQEA
jgi:2-iminobutanoate/2-iminopropanoate deaminase